MDSPLTQLRRPMPPTPRAMAYHVQKHVPSLHHQPSCRNFSNQACATYIPRPVSGTSRQASLTRLAPTDDPRSSQTNHEMFTSTSFSHTVSQSPHKSFNVIDGMPPVSFPGPRLTLSRSDSSMPSRASLFGAKVRLPSQNYSKPLLRDLEKTSSPVPNIQSPLPRRSDRTRRLSSPAKEATQASLMRPIYPYLPRSQTIGNTACFGSYSDFSPQKPTRRINIARDQVYQKAGKTDVIDLQSEEQLIRHENETPGHVYKSTLGGRQAPNTTDSSLSSDASCNEHLKGHQLKRQHHGSAISNDKDTSVDAESQTAEQSTRLTRGPLHINTGLANTYYARDKSPSCSMPRSVTTCRASFSYESSLDLKQV